MWNPLKTVGPIGLGIVALMSAIGGASGRAIAQQPSTPPPIVAQVSNGNNPDRKLEADRLYNLGVQQVQRNENDAALATLQQSLNLYQALKNPIGQMDALRYIGWAHHQLKHHSQAIEQFQASLTIARQLNNRAGEAKGFNGLGAAYDYLKDLGNALANYEKARTIAIELKDINLEAVIQENMIVAYRTAGQWQKEFELLKRNLVIYRELKQDEKSATKLLLSLALLLQKQKNYPQAIEYYEQYLTGMRQQPTFKNEALILKLIGDMYRSQNSSKENAERAIKYYNKSLVIAEKTRNESDINHALHGIGIVYMNGDSGLYSFQKATEYLEKALAGWKKLNNQVMEANALQLIGSLYVGTVGNNGKTWCDQGIGYLEQSVTLLRSLKDQPAESEALNALARCYQETQQYQKAISTQEQGLIIAQNNQNRQQEGLNVVDLAKSYRLTGNPSKAQTLAQRGVAILREIKSYQWEVYGLDELSKIHVALGDGQKAIEAQNRRVAIAHTHDVRLVNYGFNATMLNVEKAKKFDFLTYRDQEEKRLREQLTRHNFSTSLLDLLGPKATDPKQPGFFAPASLSGKIRESFSVLGDAYVEAKQYSQAIEFYQSALSQEIEKGDSVGMIDIDLLTKLGNILQRVNRMKEAESYLRLALKYGEAFRTGIGYGTGSKTKKESDTNRIFLAERKIKNFNQLQQLLVRQDRSHEALEIAEEARARTFVELLAARTTGRPLGDIPAPKLDAIRQIAKQRNATLIQYSIVDDDLLYIWVIKPTGEIRFRSTPMDLAQPLSQLVSRSRMDLGVRGRSSIKIVQVESESPKTPPSQTPSSTNNSTQETLTKLHQLLIDPIAQDLPTDANQQVIFLPQNELFLVPFAALPDVQGRYLIERHTLSTAPSIQTLEFTQALAQRPKSQKGIVVIGDPKMPEFEGMTLESLPGARQEAINIAQLFQTQPLLGEQATKSMVLQQMRSAKILHFATHGLLDTIQDNMPGAIALAPSGNDNGLLSSSEIFDLTLNADLVVLSACDTGRGKITGDGVVGLSRSFVAAGASSVLVSLWAVNDGSTNDMMTEFYRQLQQQPDKAKALRQAMLKTRERHPNPIDWAAFTLIGG